MRIGNELFFSPKYAFAQLNLSDETCLAAALYDRVEGFYLKPARQLLATDALQHNAFAAGLLCAAAIEVIARIEGVKSSHRSEVAAWLEGHFPEFRTQSPDGARTLADRFYDYFRNGLAHNGMLPHHAQLSVDDDPAIAVIGGVIVVNPRVLAEKIETEWSKYAPGAADVKQQHLLAEWVRRALGKEIQKIQAG